MAVLLTDKQGHVVTLTLNRPDKLNALNEQLLRELLEALTVLRADRSVRAAILTGAGEKAFAAGADIAAMANMTPVEARMFAELGHRVGALIEETPFPVIAAVNGFALGGGCELALCCDFIYAGERARLGQPEVGLGIIPGFGGTQRLARIVGAPRAKEMCMTGDTMSAEEALRVGLVNAVWPASELVAKTHDAAKKIADKGPLAIASVKRTISRGADAPLSSATDLEASAFSSLFGSEDQREGMRAFLEKRPASFQGK